MKYNLTPTVQNYDGSDVTVGEGEAKKPFTFKDVVVSALNSVDASTPPDEKAKRFFLTMKVYEHPEAVEFSHDDCAFVLECVRKNYTPLAVGRTEALLNAPATPASN